MFELVPFDVNILGQTNKKAVSVYQKNRAENFNYEPEHMYECALGIAVSRKSGCTGEHVCHFLEYMRVYMMQRHIHSFHVDAME